MTGRPEILWPLFAEIASLPGVGPKTAALLARLDCAHPVDLLFLAPQGLRARRLPAALRGVAWGGVVTVGVESGPPYPARERGPP